MKPALAVALAAVLAAAGFGAFVALRDDEAQPFEGEPATCESPERLRGGASLPVLAERVAADVLGEQATAGDGTAGAEGTNTASLTLQTESGAGIVVDFVQEPPCVRSMASRGLDLTATSFTSDVDGELEVRLHDAALRYAEIMRAGVAVTAGEPVELHLPPGVWAQATLVTADGRRLHALVPT